MGTVQVVNYLFPLITIPYLLRTIGINNYGIVATGIAAVQLFLIISDYGFNFIATQKIAVLGKIDNHLFSVIYAYKFLLSIIVLILTLVFFLFTSVKIDILFIVGFSFYGIFQSFVPVWAFQGLNKMAYVSGITLVTKMLNFFIIVLFVRSSLDISIVAYSYCIPALLSFLFSLYFLYNYNVRLEKVSFKDIFKELNDGKDMFLSNVIGTLYTTLNPIIVTTLAGSYATGIYSTCEKVIGVVNAMTSAVSQAVYPIVCKSVINRPKFKLFDRFEVPISFPYFGWWPLLVLFGAITFISIPNLSFIILKVINGHIPSVVQVSLLNVMIFIPFFISLGHLFGIQTLIPFNDKKSLRKSVTNGAIINMTLGIIGTYYFGAFGMGWAILICEFSVSLSMFIYVRRRLKKIHENLFC